VDVAPYSTEIVIWRLTTAKTTFSLSSAHWDYLPSTDAILIEKARSGEGMTWKKGKCGYKYVVEGHG
jgi:hypothetical protein